MMNVEEAVKAAKDRAIHLNRLKEKKIVKLEEYQVAKQPYLFENPKNNIY
ncbi:hypothetical protein N9K29_04120 [Candidatus Pelagibacter sp.]|nr:hypothetical protein [Candidatus Pelagibacter sp.]